MKKQNNNIYIILKALFNTPSPSSPTVQKEQFREKWKNHAIVNLISLEISLKASE